MQYYPVRNYMTMANPPLMTLTEVLLQEDSFALLQESGDPQDFLLIEILDAS